MHELSVVDVRLMTLESYPSGAGLRVISPMCAGNKHETSSSTHHDHVLGVSVQSCDFRK